MNKEKENFKIEFTIIDILEDIISRKNGDCSVSDRAEYWVNRIKKQKKR